MKSRRVTMQGVAQKAGVTRTTVSLALRNDPRISSGTSSKIHQLAESMGYRPDPMLSALAKYRNRIRSHDQGAAIHFLVFESLKQRASLPWLSHLIKGVETHALKMGYACTPLSLTDCGGRDHRINQILYQRGIRCLIVGPMPESQSRLNLDWDRYTAVAIGEHAGNSDLHLVRPDYFGNTVTAIGRIVAAGYRRIGFLISEGAERRFNYPWLAAYLKERAVHTGRSVFLPPLKSLNAASLRAWRKKHKPDCLVTLEPEILKCLGQQNISLPEDLGLCHLAIESMSGSPVAGIFQNLERVGETAVEMIHNLMLRDERGIPDCRQRILVSGRWVDGETLRTQ